MSRHIIAKENQFSVVPDVFLVPGSLWMDPDEQVPVTLGFDWINPPFGRATDLQRNEETGEVSVDIRPYDEDATIDEELYDVSFWAMELEEERVEATEDTPEYRRILKARVRGIALVPSAAYPKIGSRS